MERRQVEFVLGKDKLRKTIIALRIPAIKKLIIACVFLFVITATISIINLFAKDSMWIITSGLITWSILAVIGIVFFVVVSLISAVIKSRYAKEYNFQAIQIRDDCIELERDDVKHRIFYRELRLLRELKEFWIFRVEDSRPLVLPKSIVSQEDAEFISAKITEYLAKKFLSK